MTGGRTRRDRFDEVADLYERARSRYPSAIVEGLARRTGLAPGKRVLEIGCGTGQLTRDLLPYGVDLTCVEPGAALAATARELLPATVRIEEARFEDWRADGRTFEVVVAAQSFHWVHPREDVGRLNAVSEALVQGGSFAVVSTLDRSQATEFFKATQPVYDATFPPGDSGEALDLEREARRVTAQLREHPGFGPVRVLSVPWVRTYDAETYLALRRTDSSIRALDPHRREQFLEGLKEVLPRFRDRVERLYETLLITSERIG